MTSNKRTLFAVAYERRLPGGVFPRIEYLHAESRELARARFLKSFKIRELKTIKIIGVSEVVGYHVQDNHGDKLSV